MKILIDTNVFLPAEPGSMNDVESLTPTAINLMKVASLIGATIYLHPIQREDIAKDNDIDRRSLRLRLFEKYPELPSPPIPESSFLSALGNPLPGSNSWIDAHLIAALDRDLVDLLVTEDRGIHRHCIRMGRGSHCKTIAQAIARLNDELPSQPLPPPAVRAVLAHELNERDPIFQSFHNDYPGFSEWLAKCRREHRQCWIVSLHGRSGYAGVCIVNNENRSWADAYDPTLKICTFKIADDALGMKLGELLLRTVFDYANSNSIASIFIEVFPRHAALLELLDCFGFEHTLEKPNGEFELRKRLIPWGDVSSLSPFEFHRLFGPHRIKADGAQFFVVPILPKFHELLFPELQQQRCFLEGTESFGNTIRKAYLCNSGIKKVARGDVLLFYRSEDKQEINAVGVVEETLRTRDADQLDRFSRKRTVYERDDIDDKVRNREALGILFRYSPVPSNLKLGLEKLKSLQILKAAPQSIQELKEQQISWIRNHFKWL